MPFIRPVYYTIKPEQGDVFNTNSQASHSFLKDAKVPFPVNRPGNEYPECITMCPLRTVRPKLLIPIDSLLEATMTKGYINNAFLLTDNDTIACGSKLPRFIPNGKLTLELRVEVCCLYSKRGVFSWHDRGNCELPSTSGNPGPCRVWACNHSSQYGQRSHSIL